MIPSHSFRCRPGNSTSARRRRPPLAGPALPPDQSAVPRGVADHARFLAEPASEEKGGHQCRYERALSHPRGRPSETWRRGAVNRTTHIATSTPSTIQKHTAAPLNTGRFATRLISAPTPISTLSSTSGMRMRFHRAVLSKAPLPHRQHQSASAGCACVLAIFLAEAQRRQWRAYRESAAAMGILTRSGARVTRIPLLGHTILAQSDLR